MIKERWDDRAAVLVVDVVSKNGQDSGNAGSSSGCASGVTTGEGSGVHGNVGCSGIGGGSGVPENAEGTGDTSTSPPPTHPFCAG